MSSTKLIFCVAIFKTDVVDLVNVAIFIVYYRNALFTTFSVTTLASAPAMEILLLVSRDYDATGDRSIVGIKFLSRQWRHE